MVWLLIRFKRMDHRLFAYYLMHDYAYTARLGGANPPELEARMADFRRAIRAAMDTPCDEVLARAREDQRVVLARVDDRSRAQFAGAEANTAAIPLFRGTALAALLHADNPGSLAPLTKNDLDFIATLGTQVAIRLNQFEQVQQLRQQNVQLRQKLEEDFTVVTNDERMKSIMAITARVAESEATVLVSGESGTGKELIARSIHNFSRRRNRQLVAVNCAALTETLLESELFGHEKGSFTGAVDRHIGKFEAADGGTLFLDEIAEISPGAQAKLLRTLQEGEIQRVGSTKVVKVDVRLIAATNKDLAAEVHAGRFRQDLYFRLKVIEITLPPLRERGADIPELANYFLKQLRQKVPTSVKSISPEVMALLSRYPFPGNIRELRNIVERGLVFAHGDTMLPEHLPAEVLALSGSPAAATAPPAGVGGEPCSLAEMERLHIGRVLDHTGGNKLRTAQLLGISRTTLYEKLKAYNLGAGDKDA
jgi:transcriptional regulator with PAS, ATPase and Fis domain